MLNIQLAELSGSNYNHVLPLAFIVGSLFLFELSSYITFINASLNFIKILLYYLIILVLVYFNGLINLFLDLIKHLIFFLHLIIYLLILILLVYLNSISWANCIY